jgi:hypothetical protein
MGRGGMRMRSLSWEKTSSRHILGIMRTDSSSCAGMSSSFVSKAPASCSVPPFPTPKSTRPFESTSSMAMRSATLIG